MLPEAKQSSERLAPELERIAARLGPDRVLCPVLLEDHRMEWMCRWRPAPEPAPRIRCRPRDVPQPTFALSQPLRLAVQDNRPIYQGVLHLLAGAHRVEGGWWERTSCVESSKPRRRLRGRGWARDHPPRRERLLGGRERACRRVGNLSDASGQERDRLVPARHFRLTACDATALLCRAEMLEQFQFSSRRESPGGVGRAREKAGLLGLGDHRRVQPGGWFVPMWLPGSTT